MYSNASPASQTERVPGIVVSPPVLSDVQRPLPAGINDRRKRLGATWRLDPDFGSGAYWCYDEPDKFIVAAVDIELTRALTVSLSEEGAIYLILDYASQSLLSWQTGIDRPGLPSVQPLHSKAFGPGAHIGGVGFILKRDMLRPICERLACTQGSLRSALDRLDGTRRVAGLSEVLEHIATARPSLLRASEYYEAKIVEALVVLLDWFHDQDEAFAPKLRREDRRIFDRACDHIRANLDRHVPTEELCRVTYTSASKLTRLFKQAEGTTPQEWARSVRMGRACELLESTDLPIAEISSSLGFSAQGSFTEAFKTRFGKAPLAWRKSHRRD